MYPTLTRYAGPANASILRITVGRAVGTVECTSGSDAGGGAFVKPESDFILKLNYKCFPPNPTSSEEIFREPIP
jgi:hypothetical protein